MPIVLKYGAPGPIVAAGYAAGLGHRAQEQQGQTLRIWQQQQYQGFQAQQSALDRQQRAAMQGVAFQQQNQQAELNRDFAAGQATRARGFQAGQAEIARNFQAGQQNNLLASREAEAEADRQARALHDLDGNIAAGLRNRTLELPGSSQRQLDQLDNGLAELVALAPHQQEEFYAEYQRRKQAILRTAQPAKALTYDEQLAKKVQSIPEEHRNHPWMLDHQGDLTLPTGYKMPDAAGELAKAQEKKDTQITKYYDANRKLTNEEGTPKYSTPEAAMTAAIKEHETVQGMLRGQSQVTPAAQQSTSQPPAVSPEAADAAGQFMRRVQGQSQTYPEPKTKEEMQALPPGTTFRAPDGSLKKVPNPFSSGASGSW